MTLHVRYTTHRLRLEPNGFGCALAHLTGSKPSGPVLVVFFRARFCVSYRGGSTASPHNRLLEWTLGSFRLRCSKTPS